MILLALVRSRILENRPPGAVGALRPEPSAFPEVRISAARAGWPPMRKSLDASPSESDSVLTMAGSALLHR